ncbi:MAG: adenylosuccinate synthase [Myxococcales bacterium]|nr:adenylosuccinate synthase [Myxococcales bacterium]
MSQEPNRIIVGAQWGDEGKGKLVDRLASRADVVVRYQGGANAGHTLVVEGRKTVLHLVPSGILHGDKLNVIGPGCVVDPVALLHELDGLAAVGINPTPDHLLIARQAHVILSMHQHLDRAREAAAGDAKIGTTGRGIGPAYEDLVARRGIRFGDFFDPAYLRARVEFSLQEKNVLLTSLGMSALSVDEVLAPAELAFERLRPFIGDAGAVVSKAHRDGRVLLFEGAQGTMLDVLHGTYPFVTSSSTIAAGALTSLGLGPKVVHEIIGVSKAYTTRVGSGPFPTEMVGVEAEWGERLRQAGREFGATTGRPRRCGWLDVPALRYSARINGLDSIALMKTDVLQGLGPLKLCVAYTFRGQTFDELPMTPEALVEASPVYETFEGFDADITGCRRFRDLPASVQRYVEAVEARVGIPITFLSVGPGRDENVDR